MEGCFTLADIWYGYGVTPNTLLDHTLFLLHFVERLRQLCSGIDSGAGDFDLGPTLDSSTELAYLIGREHETILKKRFEPDALRGAAILKGARTGGRETARQASTRTLSVLAEMRRLIEGRGHSVKRAAQLVHANGIGKSPEANRQLWKRHARKLGYRRPLSHA